MIELFIRTLRLESHCAGEWLIVRIDLNTGIDLSSIDVASLRLNGALAVADSELDGHTLALKFPRLRAGGCVDPTGGLTLTGRFEDGLRLRGIVRAART